MTPLAFLVAYLGDKFDLLNDEAQVALLQGTIVFDLILATILSGSTNQ